MVDKITEQIVEAIRSTLVTGPTSLHEPQFQGNEVVYLKECIDSTFVSSVGKFVNEFESQLQNITGAKCAVAVMNGTAALHLSLILVGVQANDEVLVPALTFIATANAVSYCHAIPHFVDSEDSSLGMDPTALRNYLDESTEMKNGHCANKSTGRIIRAMIPMHTFGHPLDIEGLLRISRDFNIAIVEDAAESLGSEVGGVHTGNFGLLGTLSFNGNKTITTGGGGAIITNNLELGARAKHLSTTAKLPHRWQISHNEVGFNYRMPNINAALGCAQLEQLPHFLLNKRNLFDRYKEKFSTIPYVELVHEPTGCRSNYWLQTIKLDVSIKHLRDEILEATNNVGLATRPAWDLMHRMPIYSEMPRAKLPVSESLVERLINIPSNPCTL